jgi:MOSC domain-containing protein YiiM
MAHVSNLHLSPEHSFSKHSCNEVTLIAGSGVEGDAHSGPTVKHRSRVAIDPSTPNLRQVHLIPLETLTNLATEGFEIQPGDLGENITTVGINLHDMPVGTVLRIGEDTLLALTGLRNPCQQIEQFRTGLLKQCLPKDADGTTQRRAGVMSIVIHGGIVRCGDVIEISLPPLPHQPLQRI